MVIGTELREMEGYLIEVNVKKLQNKRNLLKAKYHFQAKKHGVTDEEVKMHPRHYHIYKKWESRWTMILKRTCCHYGCLHVEEIPFDKIDEANDYAMAITDKLFETDWA